VEEDSKKKEVSRTNQYKGKKKEKRDIKRYKVHVRRETHLDKSKRPKEGSEERLLKKGGL